MSFLSPKHGREYLDAANIPVFHDSESLINHVSENNTMVSEHTNWTETDTELFETTYESEHGDQLYIKDELKLDGTSQAELTSGYWDDGRYTVNFRPGYVADTEAHEFERTLEGFDDIDEAEAYTQGLLDSL